MVLKNAWNVEDDGIVFVGEVDLIREEYDVGRRGRVWEGGRIDMVRVIFHFIPTVFIIVFCSL